MYVDYTVCTVEKWYEMYAQHKYNLFHFIYFSIKLNNFKIIFCKQWELPTELKYI